MREALGNAAIIMDLAGAGIDSPWCGSRCHSSSEMNGMKGWRSRSVASSVSTSVRWVTARAAGLSGW